MKKEIFEQEESKKNKKSCQKEKMKRNNINSIGNNNNCIVNISRSNSINTIRTRWNTK